ncbi:uncharacterized protein MELLADRAFT_96159 [Melampsora larici-populina 98AG31]|uniref:Uncharacterized protein n=1 Tax=Melampsora larici-populina (strain 98AG31 / pathotype 3-4-7) TaxID=747676 RepID=F4SB65_MELLP|nr:uncharacterized protein MELLADRAFT_96159 [Melampsora larici-populina 98AG31]EGF98092.1 hypothetical protein MELLADRAFT_96159 [Melampsora larici-populina 98AG31]
MPPKGVTPPATPVKLHRRSVSMFRRSDEGVVEAIEPNVLAAVVPPSQQALGTGPPLSVGGSSSSSLATSKTPETLPVNSSSSVSTPTKLPGGSVSPPTGSVTTPPVTSGSSSTTEGICGTYNTETDLGVCLWSGSDTDGKDISKSGWVSSAITTNCGREVAVLRTGLTKPVVLKVIDGCNFATTTADVGCSQIYLTKMAFKALNPTAEENSSGFFKDALVWDFLAVSNPANVPE